MFACIHTPDARALARSFSPWVETVDEKTAGLSITPRQIAEQTLERIPHAQVAVAETVEAAILAARIFPGLTFPESGDDARVLRSVPLDCLPPVPDIFQLF